jgi:hypothetical protein
VGVRDQADPPAVVHGLPGQEAGPPDGVLGDAGEDGVPEGLAHRQVHGQKDLGAPGRLEELRLEPAGVPRQPPVDPVQRISGRVRPHPREPLALFEHVHRGHGTAEGQPATNLGPDGDPRLGEHQEVGFGKQLPVQWSQVERIGQLGVDPLQPELPPPEHPHGELQDRLRSPWEEQSPVVAADGARSLVAARQEPLWQPDPEANDGERQRLAVRELHPQRDRLTLEGPGRAERRADLDVAPRVSRPQERGAGHDPDRHRPQQQLEPTRRHRDHPQDDRDHQRDLAAVLGVRLRPSLPVRRP